MEGEGSSAGEDESVSQIYDQQTMVAISIYSFMDRLLSAIRNGADGEDDDDAGDGDEAEAEAEANEASASAAAPAVAKPGGYSEEAFFYLSDSEKEQFECRICFSILKDCHECRNRHRFCYGCIYEWSGQDGNGADYCPVCRTIGEYARNPDVIERLARKRVRCSECNWRGCLRDLEMHEHRRYEEKELAGELPSLPTKPTVSAPTPPPPPPPPHPPPPPAPPPVDEAEVPQPPQQQQQQPPPRPPRLLGRRQQGSGRRLPQSQTSTTAPQTPPSLPSPQPPSRRGSNATTVAAAAQSVSAANARRSAASSTGASGLQRPAQPPSPLPPPPARAPHPPSAPRPANAPTRPLARRMQQPQPQPQPQPQQQPQPQPQPQPLMESLTAAELPTLLPPAAFASSADAAASASASAAPALASAQASAAGPPPPPQEMQYVRLNRRPRRQAPAMAQRLQQSRDHLAVLMALLTVELDERRRAVEQHHLETRERERRRLQQLAEVQSLNRRLSLVASNLSRIVDGGGVGGGPAVAASGGQGGPLPQLPRLGRSRAGLGPPIRRNSDTDETDDDDDDI